METDTRRFPTTSEKQVTPPVAESGWQLSRFEPKKKLKKMRSIKLLKLPSLKGSARRVADSHGGAGASRRPDSIRSTMELRSRPCDSASNFNPNGNVSNSSQANADFSVHKCGRKLMRASSLRAVRITRKGSFMPKYSAPVPVPGGIELDEASVDGRCRRTEPKKKFKALGSLKNSVTDAGGSRVLEPNKTWKNQRSIKKASIRKPCSEAGIHDFETTKLNHGAAGPKRVLLFRKAGKSRLKPSIDTLKIDRIPESSIRRATCSSNLKDARFPETAVLPPRGIELREACPYYYCCLGGHSHSSLPSLSRSLSKRKRLLKTQTSLKLKGGRPPVKTRSCHDKRSERGGTQIPSIKDPAKNTNTIVKEALQGAGSVRAGHEEGMFEPKITANNCCQEISMNDEAIQTVYEVKSGVCETLEKLSAKEELTNRDCSSCHDLHERGADIGIGSHEEGFCWREVDKTEAFNPVQEALETIIPPEMDDQSSDEQSIAVDNILNQVFLECDDTETRKTPVGNFTEDLSSDEQSIAVDSTPNQVFLEDDGTETRKTPAVNFNAKNSMEQARAGAVHTGSQHQPLRKWSNVKKIILLKSFIKKLRMERELSSRGPLFMPPEHGSEAEKFYLRHRITDERKNAQEWFLDYALQQLIAKLTPGQRRKVEFLAEAFETLSPLLEVGDNLNRNTAASIKKKMKPTHSLPPIEGPAGAIIEAETNPVAVNGRPAIEGTVNICRAGSSAIKVADEDVLLEDNAREDCGKLVENFAGVDPKIKHHNKEPSKVLRSRVSCPEVCMDGQLSDFLVARKHIMLESPEQKKICLCDKSTPLKLGKGPQAGCIESHSSPVSELCTYHTESNGAVEKNGKSVCEKHDSIESIGNPSEELVGAWKGNRSSASRNIEPFKDDPLLSPDPSCSSNTMNQILSNKQKSNSVWSLLYENAVAFIEKERGTQLPRDIADKEKETDAAASSEGFIEDTAGKENCNARYPGGELKQNDAIKMVKEALEAILCPEGSKAEKSKLNFQEAKLQTDEPVEEKAAPEPKRNWNKVRRVILLQRFVAQMDRIRKINPREPRYLPRESGPEAEKVSLRHHMMGDRRNGEDWMLDHALQQAISQLAPAGKRRVALLVEAFEMVNPVS